MCRKSVWRLSILESKVLLTVWHRCLIVGKSFLSSISLFFLFFTVNIEIKVMAF